MGGGGVGVNVFLFRGVDEGREGREDPNSTKGDASSVRQRKTILMAFRWRADDGSTFAGLVAL